MMSLSPRIRGRRRGQRLHTVSGSGTVPPVNPRPRHQPRTQKTTTALSNHVLARAIPAIPRFTAGAGSLRWPEWLAAGLLQSAAVAAEGRAWSWPGVVRGGISRGSAFALPADPAQDKGATGLPAAGWR